jgi:nicotinamide mononucleotide transporter
MMLSIELVASILGLLCVWLTVRQNILCWPTGLAMVSLYIAIFFNAKLYSDMLLQCVYVVLQLYGWYAWLHGGLDQASLTVHRLPARHILPWCWMGVLLSLALGTLMRTVTDASYPYVDAFATVASLIAQWFMGRKILESWLVWILVDVVSIGLYLAKGLYPTAVLYAVFLGLATHGWFAWRNSWKRLAMD